MNRTKIFERQLKTMEQQRKKNKKLRAKQEQEAIKKHVFDNYDEIVELQKETAQLKEEINALVTVLAFNGIVKLEDGSEQEEEQEAMVLVLK